MQRTARYAFALLIAVLLSVTTVYAQATAEITGTVTDPSGAVIPGAKVTATNDASGSSQTTVSNSSGLYTLPGLSNGTYTLVVTAKGFATYKTSGVVLDVAATVQENVALRLGSSSQTVTVRANALQVQSQSNEISTLISGAQVNQIATNGRNITSLTTLGTGVSGNLPSFNGVAAQTSTATISFNGMRPDHNNYLIDGGEVYDRGSGGKIDVLPSPDAISEFQVLSSNYPPDYGISSGGTILVELKSGTRKFHGGLWEFNRNDALDAGYYFAKKNHQPSPELRLNIFGGNIGGPVWIPHLYNTHKNKTFFFVNEEWRRFVQGANPTATNTIPANDFPTAGQPFTYTPFNGPAPVVPQTSDPAKLALYAQDGLVPGQPFPNNTIPANLLDPNAVAFMGTGAIPKPNAPNNQYVASPKQPTNVREDVVRIDQNIGSKYKLMGSWIHDSMTQTIFPTQWSGDSYSTVGDIFSNPSWAAAVRLTQTLSPTVLNETGLYVNGNKINVQPAGIYQQPSGWSAKSFFNGNNADNRLPQIAFTGGPINTTYTVIYWPWHNSYLNYQLRDDLSITRGKHAFKFGFSYMREDKNQQLQADTQGDYGFDGSKYSGDAYINFLLGFASTYDQLQQQRTDHWIANTYSFYAMDNWRITPRLSLQLGLRDDIMPQTYEKNNQVANFVPADYKAADAQSPDPNTGNLNPNGPGVQIINNEPFYLNGIEQAGKNGAPRGLVKNDFYTLQPRIGFAYDASGDGRTIVRGGAGIFYERVQGNDIYNLSTTPPFAYAPSVSDVYFSDPNVSADTGQRASVPLGPAGLTAMSYYYPHPGTAQYSLGIQHQLAPSAIFYLGYVGSTSWNQDDLREINDLPLNAISQREEVATGCKTLAPPSSGAQPCPNIPANANLYRPYQGYSNIRLEENAVNADYNSLQASVRMEKWHGLTLQLAYTWSHEIDIQSADLTTQTLAGSGGDISDPYSYKYDRGSGSFDRRNIFNANYIYDLPFYMHSHNVLARTLLSGWVISGVTVAQSGSPVNVYYNGPNTLGLGGSTTNRPNIVGQVSFPKTQQEWFNTKAFADPVAPWVSGANNNQGFGDARKDTITGPGLFNWNISIFKSFPFTANPSGPHLQFRAESFNTFNHTEWNSIDTGSHDPNFGQVTNTYDPRVLQLGLKLMF
uniref:TonB-dependent receptor n=1 Tax=Acidobacterium capsulatum TaxID=33075 RepID=A0A7V4XSY8_9BACT